MLSWNSEGNAAAERPWLGSLADRFERNRGTLPGPSLVWRVHPARDRVGAACFAAAVVTAMAWLSAAMMQSVWWGALAVVVLFVALRRFFLPSQFRIDAEGITARNSLSRQRYHWSQIFRFSCDRRGGYLSTRSRSSVLDIFRGMHLLFGEDRETVVAQIRERLNSGGRAVIGWLKHAFAVEPSGPAEPTLAAA